MDGWNRRRNGRKHKMKVIKLHKGGTERGDVGEKVNERWFGGDVKEEGRNNTCGRKAVNCENRPAVNNQMVVRKEGGFGRRNIPGS